MSLLLAISGPILAILFASFFAFSGFVGCAGMLPGSAPDLRNLLCGVPLGYGDLAERLEFAVPARVLAC